VIWIIQHVGKFYLWSWKKSGIYNVLRLNSLLIISEFRSGLLFVLYDFFLSKRYPILLSSNCLCCETSHNGQLWWHNLMSAFIFLHHNWHLTFPYCFSYVHWIMALCRHLGVLVCTLRNPCQTWAIQCMNQSLLILWNKLRLIIRTLMVVSLYGAFSV